MPTVSTPEHADRRAEGVDYADITLTMVEFSEDGKTVLVEDRHGHRATLSTSDFNQNEKDALDPGDTVLCHVLAEALASTGGTLEPDSPPLAAEPRHDVADEASATDDEAGEDAEEATDFGAAAVHFVRTETITAQIGLSPREMEDIGDRMAKTVSRIEELKDELDRTRKSINERVKALQQELKEASEDWESGSVTRHVFCDMCADYDAGDMVWRDHDTGVEIDRRPMTSEERQLPLPLVYPDGADVSGMAAPTTDAATGPASPASPTSDGHGCFDCSCALSSLKDEEEIPVPCRTCARTGNGEADSWRPERKCLTCAHAMGRVDMPPCAGCERNADDAHRGGADNWVWDHAPENGEPTAADEEWGRADAQGGPEAGQEVEREGFFDPATGEILEPMPGAPVADEPGPDSLIQ